MGILTLIHECEDYKFRVFIDLSDKAVSTGYNLLCRSTSEYKKFIVVIHAVKQDVHTKSQFNFESSCDEGKIYAIKVNQHRFYTIYKSTEKGYREMWIGKYQKKETQKNNKKINQSIKAIEEVNFIKTTEEWKT